MSSESDSDESDHKRKGTRGHQSESDSEHSKILPQHITFSFDDYQIDTNKLSQSDADNLNCSSSLKETASIQSERSAAEAKKRRLLILLVFSFTEFCSGTVISLQTPFYPAEAERKGLTASEYGAVFGIFEFTIFVMSLVYGKYIHLVGPKFVYNLGMFVAGICSILFGMIDQIHTRTLFFALSMVIRIAEAMATAGCVNAVFTIIALEFPGSVATTFATMEMLFAFGLTCGPIIGGALFELGGFAAPFVTTGILLVLTSIITSIGLPNSKDFKEEKSSKGLIHLLKIPEVGVATLTIFAAAISIGHLSSTLEPHIRIFELNSVFVGLVIVISGAIYAVLAPIWGRLCDWKPMLNLYMLLGCIFTIIGFLLIGPAPFLPFDTILWVTCVGLGFHGIGLSACLVSSFIQCLSSASANGFPDNVATYSLVSGIWASFFSLGNFIGPTLSGVLYDTVGFRNGTLFIIGLESVVAIALASIICFRGKPKPGSRRRLSEFTESERLLGSSNGAGYGATKT